ncbi:MAG: hypothetical protein VKN60_06190 [Cyanobacteriota bacterium]|nr:hypothetical protein [Cyanobacteriota bacterium]
MTIDQVIECLNNRQGKSLSWLQEKILRRAWDELTYNEIAKETHYQETYIKNIASQLWQELSVVCGEPIAKGNFKSRFEPITQLSIPLSVQNFPGFPLAAAHQRQ